MLTVRLITVGTLKESYLREAADEYKKRLSAFCRVEEVALKEIKLPDAPSAGQIASALEAEGEEILSQMPPRSFKIVLCVEGKQLCSEELAQRLGDVCALTSTVCFVIGSSHGLSPRVKAACDMQLSVSRLTFPHQLMRVLLYEIIYRCMNIQRGTKYHK